MAAESVQVWIQRAINAHPDMARWVQTGILVLGVLGGRIFQIKARNKNYANVIKLGCAGIDDRGRLHHVSFDFDVGHGNEATRYPTTEAALAAARVLRAFVGGAAEIRRSKGGVGLNVRVSITPGSVSATGSKVASRIARYIAHGAGVRVDAAVEGRQVVWIFDANPAPGAFQLIEPCEGTWTPPQEALQVGDQAPPTGPSPAVPGSATAGSEGACGGTAAGCAGDGAPVGGATGGGAVAGAGASAGSGTSGGGAGSGAAASGAGGGSSAGDTGSGSVASGAKSADERPIHLVLSRLKGVRKSGGGYAALCPAHDDSNPSLSVSETPSGSVLLHCHASCTYSAVLAAIGLQPQDLFPQSKVDSGKAGFELKVSTVIMSTHFLLDGYCTLKYWRGQFFRYEEGVYTECPDSEMRAAITKFMLEMEEYCNYASAGMSSAIMGILQGMCLLAASVKPNSWTGGKPGEKPFWISMKNGIVNIQPFIESTGPAVLLRHSPLFFTLASLPYPYQPDAKAPRFKKFLEEMLPDGEIQALLAQVYGYTLIFCTKFEKFFLYVGLGANGKTVVLTVHRCLLGAANVCAVGLEAFSATRTFPLAAMVGKLANIVEEIGEMDRAAEGVVKMQVSGAPMTVERKHKDPFIMEPTARQVYSTNTLPRFVDRTDGLWRRMVLIPFRVQLLDESKQDKRLKTAEFWEQSGELPGIFNAALRGLRKLLADGKFIEPEACKVAKAEYRLDVNPARQYLLDHYEAAPKSEVWKRDLYRGYQYYCEDLGYKPMGANRFAGEVEITFPGVKSTPNAQVNDSGQRDRKWLGLRERPAPDGGDGSASSPGSKPFGFFGDVSSDSPASPPPTGDPTSASASSDAAIPHAQVDQQRDAPPAGPATTDRDANLQPPPAGQTQMVGPGDRLF